MRILNSFYKTLLFTACLFAFSSVAHAASVYQVDVATATVGTDAATIEIEYTVDTAVQTWADADTLTLTVPSNFPVTGWTIAMEYDSDVTNDGVGETASTAGAGNGQYAVAGQVYTVKWNVTGWGAVANGASTIRFLVTADAIPIFADTTSTFTFGGTTAAGGDTNPSGTDDINVSAADAAATITLGDNKYVGVTGTTTVAFTLPLDMAANDTVVVTLPSNLDATSMTAAATDTFGGAGSFSCAVSGTTLTCTASGAITAGAGTIVITGIHTTGSSDAQTTSLTTADDSNSDATVASDSSVSVTAVQGSSSSSSSITLNPPTNFKATAKEGGIELSWTQSTQTGVAYVEVLRGVGTTGTVNGTPYALVASTNTTYLDTSVLEGETYKYIIRFANSTRTSKSANTETLTVQYTAEAITEGETSTETPTETPTEGEEEEEMTYEEEKDLVQAEGVLTEALVKSANKCELLVMMARVQGWEMEEGAETTFEDVPEWCVEYAAYGEAKGIVEGRSEGMLGLDTPVSRYEFAVMLARSLGVTEEELEAAVEAEYEDEVVVWAAPYLNWLHANGVMTGYEDGTFGGSKGIAKIEAAVALWRAK